MVTATATPASVCPGGSSILIASGATSYTWMPGSLTGASVSVTPAANTIYTVTGISGGCSGSATVSVTVNPALIVSATATPSVICQGDNSTLSASGATTYAWMPGNLTGTSVTVSPLATTVYTVVGTTNGCTGTDTITVAVNPTFNLTVTASPDSVCQGGSSTLTASGANTYSWMPGSLTGNTVTVSPASSTIYTITGILNGCSETATVFVFVSAAVVVNATASPSTVCPGDNSTLTASGATTYLWMPGNLSGTSVTVSPTATTTYSVIGATNGCTGSTTVTVTTNSTLNVTATASPNTICIGGSSILSANGATSYSWMPGSLSGSSVTVFPVTPTTYTVTGISGGCSGTATVTVNVDANPSISATASPASICSGQSSVLTATGANSYLWIPGNLSGPSVNVSPTINTIYTVIGSTSGGCTGSAIVTVSILANATLAFSALPFSGCVPLTVQFHYAYDGTIDTNSLHWNFGDPSTTSDVSTIMSPSYTYTDDGNYLVTLSGITNSGCTASGQAIINVFPTPIADFLADPWVTDIFNPSIHFYDESVWATQWQWSFGDLYSNFSFLQFPDHIYSEPGNYDVMQIASNGECSDTIIKTVTILEGFTFYIPNSFTPNADKTNNVFNGKGLGFKKDDFELHIFDRWGKEIFTTTDPDEGWDGKVNGKGDKCMNGIYCYLFKVVELNEIIHTYVGTVMLIK